MLEIKQVCMEVYPSDMEKITCLVSCSSQSLYSVKNLRARVMFSRKPQDASLTLMIIWRSGTIIATFRNWIFRFSGSSWRPW